MSCSNDGVKFKVSYSPEHSFKRKMTIISKNETNYFGDKDFLTNNGIRNPTIIVNNQTLEAIFHVGAINDFDKYPWEIEYLTISTYNDSDQLLRNIKVYGTGLSDKFEYLDSTSIPGKETAIANYIPLTFPEFVFPDRQLNLHEEFSREILQKVPVAGVIVEMRILAKYKLINIDKNIAKFTIKQTYSTGPNNINNTTIVTGQSTGELQFDLDNNYIPISRIENSEFKIKMQFDNYDFEVISRGGHTMTTEILSENASQ